jgi:hypothetical protein
MIKRAVPKRLGVAIVLVGTLVWVGACETQVLPRAVGVGEVVVVGFPEPDLILGTPAEFALQLNLPEGRYDISFGIDPPGIEAEAGVVGFEGEPRSVRIASDGSLTVDEEPSLEAEVLVSSHLVRNDAAAVGVARSWALTVDAVDLYTGDRERIVDEVFPYRVQWRE